jgi:hypothetical protein
MSDNKNISIGSSVDVILKVVSNRTIANKNYVAGEPYTVLSNVGVNFSYGGAAQSISIQTGNLIDYLKQFPDTLTIQNVNLTQKIMDLLFVEGSAAQKTEHCNLTERSTYISPNATNIFIYQDNQRVPESSISYDATTGKLTFKELSDNFNNCVCFYNIAVDNCYSLETKNNAYFELDIVGKGNIEQDTSDFYMSLPTCALLPSNRFIFVPNSLNKINLVFSIIKSETGKLIIE